MLDRHAAFPNLRGIRDLRYDDYPSDETWLRGYASLARHGLVACDDPYVEQMPLARALADRYPEIVLCIDHASYPRRRDDEYFEAWRRGIQLLAGAPNVVIKISGLGMVDHAWTVESLRPWVHTCIEAFGTERSFFGTNWPVDRLYSSYGDVLDAYAAIIADLTDDAAQRGPPETQMHLHARAARGIAGAATQSVQPAQSAASAATSSPRARRPDALRSTRGIPRDGRRHDRATERCASPRSRRRP